MQFSKGVSGIVAASALALFAGAASAQPYAFTKVAETDPSGTPFSGFGNQPPAINSDGLVAFSAQFLGGAGIFAGSGGAVTTIASTTTPTIFGAFAGAPAINDDGLVAFMATRTNAAGGDDGVFASSGFGVITIALTGVPGGARFGSFTPPPSVNDDGFVAFSAQQDLSIGGAHGIFVGNGGATQPVALSSDPDIEGLFGVTPVINDAGSVVYAAQIQNGFPLEAAVFVRNASSTTEIARTSEDETQGTFASFGNASAMNASGRVAFVGTLHLLERGVYAASGGAPTHLADTGNPGAPVTIADSFGPYNNDFRGVSINALGQVVFSVGLDAGGRGIFTGPDPVADRVIATGDGLFDSTVTALFLGVQAINDRGEIAFGYVLQSGAAGIAVTGGEAVACSVADIAAVGGTSETPGEPDDQLTIDDLIVFVNLFSDGTNCPGAPGASCNRADVTGVGGPPNAPDGILTVDDLIAFVNAFSDGC